MTKFEAHDFLIELFPEFQDVWEAEDNYYRNGNSWREHGLWAEFSNFFRHNFASFPEGSLKRLFSQIEVVVSADPHDADPMANAMCTCFLENISSTEAGSRAIRYMGKSSRKFFDYWHTDVQSS